MRLCPPPPHPPRAPSQRGNVAFEIVLDAIAKHGDSSVELPGAPLPFFHFAERAQATSALTAAGFAAESVEVKAIPSVAALREPGELYGMFASATARTRATLEMQSPQQIEAIEVAMSNAVASRCQGACYMGSARSTSWLPAVVGTDEPLFDGRPSGRSPFQVPMPCVVASATKPAAAAAAKPKKAAPAAGESKPAASAKQTKKAASKKAATKK